MWSSSLVIQYVLSYIVWYSGILGLCTWSNPWFDCISLSLLAFCCLGSIHVWMLPHSDTLDVNHLHTNCLTMPFLLFLLSLPFLQYFLWVGSVSGSYERLWFYTTCCINKSRVNDAGKTHPFDTLQVNSNWIWSNLSQILHRNLTTWMIFAPYIQRTRQNCAVVC